MSKKSADDGMDFLMGGGKQPASPTDDPTSDEDNEATSSPADASDDSANTDTPPSGTYLGNGMYQRKGGPKKKIQVYLDPDLDEALRLEAARRNESKSGLIEALIDRALG